MVFAGIMLGISDRLGLGRPKGTGMSGAFAQALPPLVAVVFL